MDAALVTRIQYAIENSNTSTVIYVAIGCAQGHYAPGRHSAQQYPPFLANWEPADAERHVLLIDPALEDPPRSLVDIAADPTVDTRRITFYPIQAAFYWDNPDHRAFLTALIRLAVTNGTYLILQDYTGHELMSEYRALLETTFRNDASVFLSRVLFDPSYDGPGCFQDLSTPVLRDPATGAFLQPDFVSLRQLAASHPPPAPATLRAQQERRSALIRYYAGRLLRGEFADRPAAIEDALQRLQFFAPIVDYTPTADPATLRRLIADTLRDFGAIARVPRYYTDAQIDALLGDDRGTALNLEFHALTH